MNQAVQAPEYFNHLFKKGGSRMAAAKQSIQTWFVTVEADAGTFTTHAGQVGGKITPKVTKVKQKNIGKANETSLAEQAHIEAQAKWTRQVERKLYKEDLDDGIAPLYLPPMLAMDATKNPHRIDWEARTYRSQPKLNGVRFVAQKFQDGTVSLQSREGMYYTVEHIQDALSKRMMIGVPLDGELDLGEEFELGDVTGALKPGTANHHLLKGCMFDLVHDRAVFDDRYRALELLMKDIADGEPLELVPLDTVVSHEDMDAKHDVLADAGYEGIMIRDADGLYDYGYKGIAMFKYKKFQDAEFTIIGVKPDKDGTGGLFELNTDNSEWETNPHDGEYTEHMFTCRPKGTNEMRSHVLENPDEYIGKLLTVRFSFYLKSGVPEFNRGITKDGAIAVRDYE